MNRSRIVHVVIRALRCYDFRNRLPTLLRASQWRLRLDQPLTS